jgi:hypothetical protein
MERQDSGMLASMSQGTMTSVQLQMEKEISSNEEKK